MYFLVPDSTPKSLSFLMFTIKKKEKKTGKDDEGC